MADPVGNDTNLLLRRALAGDELALAALFDAYREIAPVEAGFAVRRDLWRICVDLACVTVEAIPFGPYALGRLGNTVRSYK